MLPFLRINRAKLSSFTRTSSIFFGVDTKGGPKGDGFSKWGRRMMLSGLGKLGVSLEFWLLASALEAAMMNWENQS